MGRNRTNGLEALVGTPGYYALKAEYSGVCDEKVLKERGVEKPFWLRCPAKMSELFKNNDTADEIIVDLNGVPFRSDIQDLISAAKNKNDLKQTLDKKFDLLVINAGDAIRRWTNDYWKSPVHRVMQIPGEP